MNVEVKEFDPRIIPILQHYNWPGNIREFQNVVERMVNMAAGGSIGLEHLPEEIINPKPEALQPVADEQETPRSLCDERNRIKKLPAEKERRQISYLLTSARWPEI